MIQRCLAPLLCLGLTLASPSVRAEEAPIRIGVLSDMSGNFADVSGPGTVLASRIAIEDYRKSHPGRPVEVLSGDHQNKPDLGNVIARRWLDTEKVDAILDVANSAIALTVSDVVRNANKTFLASGPSATMFHGEQCSPNLVHYALDAWTMANVPTGGVVDASGDTWFFITPDYAFGHDLERLASAAVKQRGGKVLGSVKVPLGTSDMSSFLLSAQSSGAKIIALALSNASLVTAIKQGAEFGIGSGKTKFVGLPVYISDIVSLGNEAPAGMVITDNWYWDLNDATRDFTKRFRAQSGGKAPTSIQAAAYSATWQFLKAVYALGGKSDDGKAVVAKMKELPADDPIYGPGSIRADGRKLTPIYVFEIKKPSHGDDYLKVARTVDVDHAYRPMAEGNCKLVPAR